MLYKLEIIGVRDPLLAQFRSYLTNRRHRTVIDGRASYWSFVPYGVPQGSIIGPFLFLIFINNITDNISVDTQVLLYTDDANCSRELLNDDDHATLQSVLYLINDWSELWGMSFNVVKCEHLSITRKINPDESSYILGKTS